MTTSKHGEDMASHVSSICRACPRGSTSGPSIIHVDLPRFYLFFFLFFFLSIILSIVAPREYARARTGGFFEIFSRERKYFYFPVNLSSNISSPERIRCLILYMNILTRICFTRVFLFAPPLSSINITTKFIQYNHFFPILT